MSLQFSALNRPSLAVGLVLRLPRKGKFLRITHVFRTFVYVIRVSDADDVRDARLPFLMPLSRLQKLSEDAGATWGTLSLPVALSEAPLNDSDRVRLDSTWELIEPLVTKLKKDPRLLVGRRLASEIRQRAIDTGVHYITIKRVLLRYYYFGCRKRALLSFPPGPRPLVMRKGKSVAVSGDSKKKNPPKRRGPKSILTATLGPNKFSPTAEDVKDMRKCLKRLLRKGVTYLTEAHDEYLKHEFRLRHLDEYTAYISDQCQEPVTYRQFRYYVTLEGIIEDDLAKNLRLKPRNEGYKNAHRAMGPGEIYELDATGGRIILVSKKDPTKKLGTPYIYIVVDRWSRYILSVYVTLRHPSHEQVATAVQISITSRDRFRFLHLDVDEDRWPVGVPPVSLLPDRGSEMTCRSFQEAVAGELHIGIINPQPYSPDAKAIVERLIRELKRRMKTSGLKGVFAERPLTPDARLEKAKAAEAATESIWDLYRILIKLVDEHNNRPHKSLKRNLLLRQAGIAPTPRKAYLWGLDNITGLQKCELPTEDVRRILLSSDTATITDGVLSYRGRVYESANAEAAEFCRRSPRRATTIRIKVDRTAPFEVFVPSQSDIWAPRGIWAHFWISEGAAAELGSVTLDEEDALGPSSKLVNKAAEHEARRHRVSNVSAAHKRPNRRNARTLSRKEQNAARALETAELRAELNGKRRSMGAGSAKKPPVGEKWREYEGAERHNSINKTRERLGLA